MKPKTLKDLEEIDKEIKEIKERFSKLDFLMKKQILDFSKELRKLKSETVKWIRLYCEEVGIIVDRDPLDEIFVDKHKTTNKEKQNG